MKTWFVEVDFSTRDEFSEETAFALMSKLRGMPISIHDSHLGGTITVSVTAANVAEATNLGLSEIYEAASKTLGPLLINRLEVMTDEHLIENNKQPLWPEVVGYAEIARMAGVTRQTAKGYATTKSFPKPAIVTAQGPLMVKAEVEAWLDARQLRLLQTQTVVNHEY